MQSIMKNTNKRMIHETLTFVYRTFLKNASIIFRINTENVQRRARSHNKSGQTNSDMSKMHYGISTSIVSSNTANIITESTYDSSTNKIATMSDVPNIIGEDRKAVIKSVKLGVSRTL